MTKVEPPQPQQENEPLDLATEVRRLRIAFEQWRTVLKWALVVLVIDVIWTLGVSYTTVRDYQFRGCMQKWAEDYTDRGTQLQGPANTRFQFFLGAFRVLLGEEHSLSRALRAAYVAELDSNRATFTLIPALPRLVKLPDAKILVYHDVLSAIRADDMYNKRSSENPIPLVPNCGGLL